MSDNTAKRFGSPTKKILGYVVDAYSKNFNGKTIPLDKLNIVEELPNFGLGTVTYYVESKVNKFDYHNILAVVKVNEYYDVISCKIYGIEDLSDHIKSKTNIFNYIHDTLMVIDINEYDYIISRRMVEEFDNE